MRYEVSQQGDSTILQITEERFDAKLAPEFRVQIETIQSSLSSKLVLDLGQVKFMDSSGLGAVMGVYKLLRDKQICVANAQKPVLDLFKLTRMDRLIKTYSSVDAAIKEAV
ncbi:MULTISPECIES: STAS domain-containing protein [Vibrio]|uniref:Anti-sigma factor antagonist n=1 Tax=Vibrio rotiferianus TaxID=190895 RepID=A0A7Y3Z6D6_9VIBR|nr:MULTISPECIES: STAS domain-containing protein [Vibrio]MDK9776034.1 STAS domain-containing protein [Vibrio sp. D401a]MDK9805942.1 STAS domain-containing protein [Vibrio sp. D406a]NOH47339.1 STAS domain-containing protein [Vibrio rotiferianus]USD52185.1 STAS domain-containing protein [Vibrio sp. SCSIO 43153]